MNDEKKKFKEAFAERLMVLSVDILHFADGLKKNRTFWPVADQVVRSATSVGANVHEAKGASSKRDYIHYFQIATKSAHETKFWLQVARRYDNLYEVDAKRLFDEVDQITKILTSSILTM